MYEKCKMYLGACAKIKYKENSAQAATIYIISNKKFDNMTMTMARSLC